MIRNINNAKLKTKLVQKREELLQQLHRQPDSPIDNPDNTDLARGAQHLTDKNTMDYLAEKMLIQIEQAINRIDQGVYGICKQCGQEILPERLEIMPYAETCITCQKKEETHPSIR